MNEELEGVAKELYDYWFVQFDFPDGDGRPYKASGGKMEWNAKLKREIPAGWTCVNLKSVIKHINTGLNPRDNFTLGVGDIKYITVKNLTREGYIDFSGCDVIDQEAREKVHRRSCIQSGDILFASISPLGRCSLICEEPEDWDINESVFSIRPDVEKISAQYLYQILRDPLTVLKMEQKSTGSIFKGIRVRDLESLEIMIPAKRIVDEFSEIMKLILEQQNSCNRQIRLLVGMRDELLPMLMNGQATVG